MNTTTTTTAPMADALVPRLARGFRLQWEEVQGNHVLLYPEGMVKLNRSAGEILSRCNGRTALPELVGQLEQAFNAQDLRPDVEAFLRIAAQNRWVEWA